MKEQIEKQAIEEMAKIIQNVAENHHRIWCEELAKVIYNAGYRKQSVGEWKLGKSGLIYFCDKCRYAAHPREEEEWNFCPNCGARMKGGAE